ncbi:MAG: two-component system sensor histidine kinase NtrB [Minwuia sp.]|uniref:two-component system sensor histidine kinase NtrB n=1 Tax=Minwuia sp. TaxID=2493630 RepID=UPI003A8825D5
MKPPKLHEAVVNALADPVLVADRDGRIMLANPAAEEFFGVGQSMLRRQTISDIAPFGSPLLSLFRQATEALGAISEYGVLLGTPKSEVKTVNIQLSPIVEQPGSVVIQIEERTMASKMDRSLTHRGAARAVTGMAAVLAHEVKNPLSGIRGAAQLLEAGLEEDDRELTGLIIDEVQRIVALVDRMEAFSDPRPSERKGCNIHQVLERVKKVAESGFGKSVRFIENYDPSLPMVLGNQDQLIQVFMNLVKNGCEAAPDGKGEITLSTAYRHGVRLAVPGSAERVELPLEVTIADNGPGVPEDLRQHMFDPFVSTKPSGTGLGLALVAKTINDHGGIIEYDASGRGAVFRIYLPVAKSGKRKDKS